MFNNFVFIACIGDFIGGGGEEMKTFIIETKTSIRLYTFCGAGIGWRMTYRKEKN